MHLEIPPPPPPLPIPATSWRAPHVLAALMEQQVLHEQIGLCCDRLRERSLERIEAIRHMASW